MKTLIAIIILTIYMPFSYAQSSPENTLGAWYMLDANHTVSNKFSVKTGLQLRSYEVLDNINLLFLYTGVNYSIKKNTTLTLTYCYLDIDKTFTDVGYPHQYENRFYEQLSYKHKILNIPIYHRFRVEHRFLNYIHKLEDKHRVRYTLGTKINLSKDFFINTNNEFFANLKEDTFTENRFYAAIGLNVSKNNNVQFGYLNHKINGLNLHRLQVGLYIKTDLRKKTN
jgi:hypothetical protein